MTAFNAEAFKATTQNQWDNVADKWNAWGDFLERWFLPSMEKLVEETGIIEGSRVLIVAGGSGQEALAVSSRVGASGYVMSTDISENLSRLAKMNTNDAGASNVDVVQMDGENLDVPQGSFDVVMSRVGLIFFPDKKTSLEQQIKATKSGGYVGAIVYSTAEENRFFSDPVSIIRRHAQLPLPAEGQPGPFSLGGDGVIEDLFKSAGLVDISVEKIPSPIIMKSSMECLRFEQESFGALHQMLSRLSDEEKQAAWDEVGQALASYDSENGFVGPCTLLVAVGRKP